GEGLVPLLRAFGEIMSEAPGWRIVIAGEDKGKWRRMLEAAIRRKGASDKVSMADAPDPAAQRSWLQRADLLASPALHIRCPVSIMQAMAAGVNVIASEWVAPAGLDGTITTCGVGRKQLGMALRSAIALPDEERAAAAARARKLAQSLFDWSVLVGKYVQLYRSLGSKPPMNPTATTGDTLGAGKRGATLHTNESVRILALLRPFWKLLLVGLLATVAFATLHTVSISAAFPVFKILLDEEGLTGWMNRTIAGRRLGLEFAPLHDVGVGVLKVTRPVCTPELCPGVPEECWVECIQDEHNRPVVELLGNLVTGKAGTDLPVKVTLACPDQPKQTRTVSIHLAEPEWEVRLLASASALIPANADADKLGTLKYLLFGLLLTVVAANVFRYAGEVLISKAILRGMMDLRAQLYEHALRLPMSFFSGRPTADVVTHFVQDVQEVQRGLLTLFGKSIREPLRAVFIFGLAFALDWRITLTMVVVAPVAVAVFLAVGRSVKKANRRLLEAYGAMIGALTASLHSLRVVKAYTAEDHERDRLWRVDLAMLDHQLRLARLRAFVSPMLETLAIIAGSVVTVWLASRVLEHELSMSKFAALGVTLSVLFDPLRKLTDVYVRIQRATAGAERICHLLDQPIEEDDPVNCIELQPLKESIEYVDVTFTYPGANEPALRNVNISIHKGETVAIVGPNGCGKTTLVSLLPRLFDPDSGEIRYDGIDIRRAALKSLRRHVGLVSQDAVVFAGTPIENIAYGLPDADETAVLQAAGQAYADEFIRNIPGGYKGKLGERGTTLSGGQRQRLAIARAVFRNAPILVFDEATSQIDTESEQKIQTALTEFARGRTTLVIAHRLSTIQFADRIIVMDAGKVVASGRHEYLFQQCPLYRNLCETQFLTQQVEARS
ncbi:MAG: ATP-binding cassette domain-containing protein, partial [Phycisphaerae bacterium]